MFTLNVFKILLFEVRSILWSTQRVTGSERVKKIGNIVHISAWKSRGLSDESVKSLPTYDNSLAQFLNYIYVRPRIKLDDQHLKQDIVTFTHKKVLNI